VLYDLRSVALLFTSRRPDTGPDAGSRHRCFSGSATAVDNPVKPGLLEELTWPRGQLGGTLAAARCAMLGRREHRVHRGCDQESRRWQRGRHRGVQLAGDETPTVIATIRSAAP
jgi:hypothetical protein